MMCPDCGGLRHDGACQRPEVCRECGEPLPDGEISRCQDCRDFLEERECRAAMAWYDIMEDNHERAR